MDFKSSIKSVLSKYVRFEGRASRSEYWYWILALVLTSILLSIIEGAVLAPLQGFEQFDPQAGSPLNGIDQCRERSDVCAGKHGTAEDFILCYPNG